MSERIRGSTGPGRREWTVLGAMVALAALGLAALLHGGRDTLALPAYDGIVEPPLAARLGRAPPPGDPDVLLLEPGDRLSVTLRPAVEVENGVEIGAYLLEDGSLSPWRAPAEIHPGGVVHVVGSIGHEAELPVGRSTLVFVVAYEGALPDRDEVTQAIARGASGGARWRIVLVPVSLGPSAPSAARRPDHGSRA